MWVSFCLAFFSKHHSAKCHSAMCVILLHGVMIIIILLSVVKMSVFLLSVILSIAILSKYHSAECCPLQNCAECCSECHSDVCHFANHFRVSIILLYRHYPVSNLADTCLPDCYSFVCHSTEWHSLECCSFECRSPECCGAPWACFTFGVIKMVNKEIKQITLDVKQKNDQTQIQKM